jgi:hypothetical protein
VFIRGEKARHKTRPPPLELFQHLSFSACQLLLYPCSPLRRGDVQGGVGA